LKITTSTANRQQANSQHGRGRAFLIDGTAFCYRAFYALQHLSTADGRPTNAVYGFAMMLQSLRQKERPDYLGVAFDVGKPTFRHQKFAAYKIQRKPMPEALIAQLPVVKALLAAYRVPVFEQAGYEAEDVLATIAQRIATEGIDVFLVTGDKDALQLVNSHITVYNPHKEDAVFDAEAVRKRFGVPPQQMVDLMALMGDEIDNIPGVSGIGEKTATQLLQQFGSLKRLYDHLDEVDSPTRRKQLAAAREQVELAKTLASIDSHVPLEVRLEALAIQEPDWKSLRTMFRDLEFKRLLREVETQQPQASRRSLEVQVADSEDALNALGQAISTANAPVALMCWPLGSWSPGGGDIPSEGPSARVEGPSSSLLLGLGVPSQNPWLVPLARPPGPPLTRAGAGGAGTSRLMEWLADPSRPKIGHEVKTTFRLLARHGITLNGIVGDTLLAAYLLNPSRVNQRLTDLSDEYLDERLETLPAFEGLLGLAASQTLQEAGRHIETICRLHEALLPQLQERQLEPLYRDVELPLAQVLAQMEATGIAVDQSYLQGLHASMQATLSRLTDTLYELAGAQFNLNSPKQLAQVLFERLKLPVIKRTKTGPSTDSDVLTQLAAKHPLPQRLLEYRELSKLVSTYVDALPRLVDPDTGRIHTTFNQTATATGRLSSSEPNLQNIPIKTDLGRQIRKAFVPGRPYELFVAVDYSQIELRILAHLSRDPQLIEAFQRNHDIHRFTASLIYGLPEAEVQPEQRNAMKAINYGILYGMSAHGLAKELGIDYGEAQAFIDAYFARYPRVRSYLDEQIARATEDGFVQTRLGRRRYIPELRSPDPMVRQFGERMAVNAPIQGSAADLMKRAMLEVSAHLKRQRLESRMILQVHDELLFEARRQELGTLVGLVRSLMEQAMALEVPLAVTVKSGPNWLELTPVT
jgi:DNA polymerase-1